MSPDEARTLMHEWTTSPALRVHMEAVAACMRAYARRLDAAEDRWSVAGLLHDFDYEKRPAEHPAVGVAHLRGVGVDEEILAAILGHAHRPGSAGVARTSAMARALFACDELAGFIVACAKVRPDGIASLEPRSVKKKLKDRAFAAAVNREDIAQGIAELGVDETEHIQTCIEAIRSTGIT